MPFRCLFHVHTRCSFDSVLSPRKILAKARGMQVDVVIVTDHCTIQGSLDVQGLARGSSPMVVIAAEYQSEKGDIIGLFLKEEIRSRCSGEIIQQIHAQGGIVVLPHPYKGHLLDDELISGVDVIETYNGRCSPRENEQAAKLAQDWNRPYLAGADAHCASEIGAAVNEFLSEAPLNEGDLREYLLRSSRSILTRATSPVWRPYSQVIKAVKTRNPRLFLYQAKRMAMVLACGENH
jgi:hypothetical protein